MLISLSSLQPVKFKATNAAAVAALGVVLVQVWKHAERVVAPALVIVSCGLVALAVPSLVTTRTEVDELMASSQPKIERLLDEDEGAMAGVDAGLAEVLADAEAEEADAGAGAALPFAPAGEELYHVQIPVQKKMLRISSGKPEGELIQVTEQGSRIVITKAGESPADGMKVIYDREKGLILNACFGKTGQLYF